MNYMGSLQLKGKYVFHMRAKCKIVNTSNMINEILVNFYPKKTSTTYSLSPFEKSNNLFCGLIGNQILSPPRHNSSNK